MFSPLTDALGRIDVASKAGRASVDIPISKAINRVLKILIHYGAIANYIVQENSIIVFPHYKHPAAASLVGIQCISTKARRIYVKYKTLATFAFSYPQLTLILSTRYGITTFDKLCIHGIKSGGELLAIFET
jgi:ribosomal protein S8